MENNLELLPLTDDYIFKRVFAYKGNESVLKDFLEALLKIEIKGIKITNPEIIPYEKGEKRGLLDIKAEINDGTMLDVEMQMKNERNTDERATEYMGKMISEQLQVGEDYQNLKKSIVIFITNYNFLKRNSYHSVGKMKFDKTIEDEYVNMGYDEEDELASKYIEVHYIELPKFKKKELSKFTKLDQWMCIFTQNKEGIMLAEKENKEIKRAINTLDFLSKDPKERETHNSIVMAEYNRLVSEHNFFNDGLEKGMKKRKKRKFNRNSKRNAERKYDNRNDNEIYKIKKGRNRKIKII
jgi:predicted transposase/invertase (TIGR01784 family)